MWLSRDDASTPYRDDALSGTVCMPFTRALRDRLAPFGRTTRTTGRSRTSATCQALASGVTPPTPS